MRSFALPIALFVATVCQSATSEEAGYQASKLPGVYRYEGSGERTVAIIKRDGELVFLSECREEPDQVLCLVGCLGAGLSTIQLDNGHPFFYAGFPVSIQVDEQDTGVLHVEGHPIARRQTKLSAEHVNLVQTGACMGPKY